MTVTTVDSGSKALKFLGLQEDEQSNPDTPYVSPNNHQVKFLSLPSPPPPLNVRDSSSFLIIFHLFWFYSLFFGAFAGNGSESYYYRLLYAWHDRLWFAQESKGISFFHFHSHVFILSNHIFPSFSSIPLRSISITGKMGSLKILSQVEKSSGSKWC